MTKNAEAFLAHHGVLGMKWGKHLMAKNLVKVPKRAPSHPDHQVKADLLKRPARTLSNEELKQINNRLNLERPTVQIQKNRTAISRGKKAVAGVLAVGATVGSLVALVESKHGQKMIALAKKALANA